MSDESCYRVIGVAIVGIHELLESQTHNLVVYTAKTQHGDKNWIFGQHGYKFLHAEENYLKQLYRNGLVLWHYVRVPVFPMTNRTFSFNHFIRNPFLMNETICLLLIQIIGILF